MEQAPEDGNVNFLHSNLGHKSNEHLFMPAQSKGHKIMVIQMDCSPNLEPILGSFCLIWATYFYGCS